MKMPAAMTHFASMVMPGRPTHSGQGLRIASTKTGTRQDADERDDVRRRPELVRSRGLDGGHGLLAFHFVKQGIRDGAGNERADLAAGHVGDAVHLGRLALGATEALAVLLGSLDEHDRPLPDALGDAGPAGGIGGVAQHLGRSAFSSSSIWFGRSKAVVPSSRE